MTTPTLRMLERQMQFRRQQEEARANRPAPTPDDLYQGARKFLRLDPAAARRFAGLEEPPPFVPPAPTVEPPVDWQKVAGSLMRNIEELMLHQQRSSPQTLDDGGVAAPALVAAASVPTPAPATSKPREVAIMRDLDGELTHAVVGDQRYRFQRRDGRIERAESDKHAVIFRRDHTGQIVGARLEPKEKP